ncbi:MAG TPA: VOC family protein [Vicinamibacterales bacterium]|jgi:catechol 2,3-dioxygenase-like lactoylglutathione lyase family enzyme|nr:VOC family protein [Vicinamibacterales bacterium]
MIDRRSFLLTVPALAYAPRLIAQGSTAPFHATGLSQLTLTVSDVAKSLDFYQGLFGMPVQARQGSTVLLRIGAGPKFLELRPAAAGERPSISALGFAVERFDIDRAVKTLGEHGVAAAAAGTDKPAAMQYLVRTRKADLGGSGDGTRELFVADPSGVVFQMHDVSYCGGSGAQGNVCRTIEPSKRKGIMAVTDMSHFTINANDPRTVPFYQELFGFQPQAYQAATPAWGVGDGVHFLMFTGNAGGPTRGGGPAAAPRAGAPPANPAGAGAPPAAAGAPGRGLGPARAGVDHACMSMNDFDPAKVTQQLVDYGLTKQDGQGRNPLVTYISLRMPNRGGAEGGTPELYFTDPDGLAIQLQDVKYCGGGGFLGEVCPPL